MIRIVGQSRSESAGVEHITLAAESCDVMSSIEYICCLEEDMRHVHLLFVRHLHISENHDKLYHSRDDFSGQAMISHNITRAPAGARTVRAEVRAG